MSASEAIRRVWARRPARAVARLLGRELFVVSMRDLLAAAAREQVPLVAFSAPAPAAIRGFARAARDADAPLLLVRPSGDSGEKGPEESRDDAAFTDAAFPAGDGLRFLRPVALVVGPPRAA